MRGTRKFDQLPTGPFVIGHRGSGADSPHNPYRENTIESFLHALDNGAGWVELDTKTNADGTLVVHHDVAVNGTLISSMTDEQCRTAELAFMDDVHAALPLWVGIDFEIKFDLGDAQTDTNIQTCLEWAFEHARERPLVVTSFDPITVNTATRLRLPSGWITHKSTPLYEAVASAARLECAFVVAHEDSVLNAINEIPGTKEIMSLIESTGMRLWAWDVKPENVPTLLASGVTGLCTDEITPIIPNIPSRTDPSKSSS